MLASHQHVFAIHVNLKFNLIGTGYYADSESCSAPWNIHSFLSLVVNLHTITVGPRVEMVISSKVEI
jgi:hypothetical protein